MGASGVMAAATALGAVGSNPVEVQILSRPQLVKNEIPKTPRPWAGSFGYPLDCLNGIL